MVTAAIVFWVVLHERVWLGAVHMAMVRATGLVSMNVFEVDGMMLY